MRRALADRCPVFGSDREAEPSGEADRPQRAEAVLAQPLRGLPHATHDPRFEVATAVERVPHHQRLRVHRDGVDREVAAREILLERGAEADDRMPAVGLHVVPEGRDLVQHAGAVEHPDRPELDAHRHRDGRSFCTCSGSADVAMSQSSVAMPRRAIRN